MMEGYTDVCVYVWMGGWKYRWMDAWMLDGWMDDGWLTDEWKDRQVVITFPGTTSLINYLYPSLLWGC